MMTDSFKKRLFPRIPEIARFFWPTMFGDSFPEENCALSPGFHIYDELGIRQTIKEMKGLFFTEHPGTNFFAVKACPNIEILKIILDMGFGLDCSSPTELFRAKIAGAKPGKVMYTSNNTNPAFYPYALDIDCILNLDDISFLDKISKVPKRICFRYNPGYKRTKGSNTIIGNPPNQKYGLRDDQIERAYKMAAEKGAEIFGIHTMFVSNCRDAKVLAGNAKMLLEVVERIQDNLGFQFEFINIGGGLGIKYKPRTRELDLGLMARLINEALNDFKARRGYVPKLYLESGRYVTGPHGVFVTPVLNVMNKYKKFIGIGSCDAADVFRLIMYPAYHQVSIVDKYGVEKRKGLKEIVSIVGPLCENLHMVSDRRLPVIKEGDYVVVQDTGAHGIAMSMTYNNWTPSQELLLKPDDSIVRISRAGTIGDLLIREMEYKSAILK